MGDGPGNLPGRCALWSRVEACGKGGRRWAQSIPQVWSLKMQILRQYSPNSNSPEIARGFT